MVICGQRRIFSLFSFLLVLSFFCINFTTNAEYKITDIGDMKYSQKIEIPIDTSLDESKFQPIDIRLLFDNTCWGLNETWHSIRVGYDDGSGLNEIESQVYDIEFSSDNNIESCSIVFLIPKEANGNEEYFLFYDDSETTPSNYENHLSIVDTHYFYEPISGQKMDFDYYQIIEDGYIVYAVCQKGELIGNGMSNNAIKMKSNITDFEPINTEQIAVFYISYSIDPAGEYTGSQWANEVKKTILVNGNLMVRLQVEGVSPNGVVKTDNIYTYYYNPSSSKSININLKHEVLETTEIKGDKERDCVYTSLASFKSRSATIKNMNIGNILPFIHFYSEDDTIKEYEVPVDPDSHPEEWILTTKDDNDLGEKAWISMDNPSTGKAHSLIFESNKNILEGENDGIQIKASTHQHVKLPGLEGDTGDVYACRNAYENGNHNTLLEEGFSVNFNLLFSTFEKNGYESVDRESDIFRRLISTRPIYRDNVSKESEEEKERFILTSYVHFAPTFPLGSLLSAATGKNISYTYIELFKDNNIKSSGSSGRLPVGDVNLEFDNTTLVQKIKMVIGLFDWKNISFFKKIVFPDLEQGTYLIKVFKENPFRSKERKYIGFGIVDLEEDTTIRIICRPQVDMFFSIVDEVNKGVNGVEFRLMVKDVIISKSYSDLDGKVFLNAPCYRNNPYVILLIYKGFLIGEEDIHLRLFNTVLPVKENFSTELYDLILNVKDKLGLAPAVDISPSLTSDKMLEMTAIRSEMKSKDQYEFNNLYPSNYVLKTSYKSFVEETYVEINGDTTVNLEFPAEFSVDFDMLNSYGMIINTGKITLNREGKSIMSDIKNDGKTEMLVPPGDYEMIYRSGGDELAKQNIDVKGDKSLEIVSSESSLFHDLIFYIGIGLVVFSLFFMVWKKDVFIGMKLIAIALIVVSIVSPWWILSGDNGIANTDTKTIIFPSVLVTITKSSDVIGGEVTEVTDEFILVLNLILILIFTSIFSVLISLYVKNRFPRVNKIFSILSILFLVVIVVLFYFVMSQVTEVSVGCFSGSGDLDTAIPGLQKSEILSCSWGPGIGFYLCILSLVSLIGVFIIKIINKFFNIS